MKYNLNLNHKLSFLLKPLHKLYFATTVLVAFLLIGCEKEALPISEQTLSEKAQYWYAENHNVQMDENPNFSGQPDWNNYDEVDDQIYFPLVSESGIEHIRETSISKNDIHKKVYSKPYLVLNRKNKSSFEESLKVFVTYDKNNFDTTETTVKLPFVNHKFDIEVQNVANPVIAKRAGCTTYIVTRWDFYDDGSVESTVTGTFELCDADGGGGGGSGDGGFGGDGSDNPFELLEILDLLEEYPFPHCSSFEYAKIGPVRGAIVNNVHNIFVSETPDGDIRVIRANIIKLYLTASLGNTNGQAATMSARAFYNAEELAKAWFQTNSFASKEMLGEAWYGFIQQQMALIGGTASRNNLNSFTHSGAEFSWDLFGTGNCD